MAFLQTWPGILITVAALLNVAATLETVLSPFLLTRQRVVWLAFIWLVPIVGAIVSLIRAWRNYRGLARSMDDELMSDVADLTEVPVVRSSRGRLPDSWGEDTDD